MASPPNEVTQLLQHWGQGDESVIPQLYDLVEAELHRLVCGYMRREATGHILQPGVLVNEAWLRLLAWRDAEWQSYPHFLGVVAWLMQRVLVDYARQSRARRHGGAALRVSLTEAENQAVERTADLVALDDALTSLAEYDKRKSRIVELRFFGGLTEAETAQTLNLPLRTVQREWSQARMWLYHELNNKSD